jgi:hypothetical protein
VVVVAGHVDVVDLDVDLDDLETDEAADRSGDGGADVVRDLLDGSGVLDDDGQVCGGLRLADLDLDALREVGGVDGVADGAEGACSTATERVHAGDLTGGDAGDLATTPSAIVVLPAASESAGIRDVEKLEERSTREVDAAGFGAAEVCASSFSAGLAGVFWS